MNITIFKKGKNEITCKPFLIGQLVSRQSETIIVQTQTWFAQELGVSYFVDTAGPSDALVLVEFHQNSQMDPPFVFEGTIDTSIQCKRSDIEQTK